MTPAFIPIIMRMPDPFNMDPPPFQLRTPPPTKTVAKSQNLSSTGSLSALHSVINLPLLLCKLMNQLRLNENLIRHPYLFFAIKHIPC